MFKQKKMLYQSGKEFLVASFTTAVLGLMRLDGHRTVKADSCPGAVSSQVEQINSEKPNQPFTAKSQTRQVTTFEEPASTFEAERQETSKNKPSKDNKQVDKFSGTAATVETEKKYIWHSQTSNIEVKFNEQTGTLTVPGGTATKPVVMKNPNSIASISNVAIELFKQINFTGKIKLQGSVRSLFMNLKVEKITGLANLDTAKVTDMAGMFFGCSSLTEVDVSQFDTAQVQSMYMMFAECHSLQHLDLSNFDMRYHDENLEFVNSSAMFLSMNNLTVLKIGKNCYFFYPGLETVTTPTVINTRPWVNVGGGTINQPAATHKWVYPDFIKDYQAQKYVNGNLVKFPTHGAETYIRLGEPVDVHYEDESGRALLPADVEYKGPIADSYAELAQIKLSGYNFKKIKNDADPVFSDQAKSVTFVYTKSVAAPIIIHYQDKYAHKLAEDQELTGKVGDKFDGKMKKKNIPGYIFDHAEGATMGIFTEQSQEIKYIYTKKEELLTPTSPPSPATSAPVTPIGPGQPATPTQPAAPGHHNTTNENSTVPSQSHAKASTAKQQRSPHVSAAKPRNKAATSHFNGADNNSTTAPKAVKGQASQNNTLPQTGKDKWSNVAMLALGGLMLVGVLGGALLDRRKK